jgi:hypothetical protein
MVRQKRMPAAEQAAILNWTASLGAVTAEALAERRETTLVGARARLRVLVRAGWLAREQPLAGAPALYVATRAGLRACGAWGIDPCRVSAAGARHLIVCAAVAAALERRYPDQRVIGERELRRDERVHGARLASARLGPGPAEEGLHRPDLVLWPRDLAAQAPVAVEVELTVKAPRRLTQICRAWARCAEVAGVLYLAPPGVARALGRAIEQARAQEQVVVVPLDALLPGEAPVEPPIERTVPSDA